MKKLLLTATISLLTGITMAQSYSLTTKRISSGELNSKTESVLIAIKNLSNTNDYYFVGNTGAAPYSLATFTDAAVFVWEPVTAGTAGSYYLKKLDGTYMQKSSPKDFGPITGAAVFTTTNPTTAGSGSTKFNGNAASSGYIDDATLLVRFVIGSTWINVQNSNEGTPLYNAGPSGWTIHYVYTVEGGNVEPTPTSTGTIDLTFTKVDANNATVAVAGNGINATGITAIIGCNYAWKSLSESNSIFPTNSMLCPAQNTSAMTSGSEGIFTITLNNIPEGYSFKNATFTNAALTGGGTFQESNQERLVNFTLKKSETTLSTATNDIHIDSSSGIAATTEIQDVANAANITIAQIGNNIVAKGNDIQSLTHYTIDAAPYPRAKAAQLMLQQCKKAYTLYVPQHPAATRTQKYSSRNKKHIQHEQQIVTIRLRTARIVSSASTREPKA